MRALDHKLVRNLLGMRGQVMAIVLVIASGIAAYVASASTLASLRTSQATFYRAYGFGDVFATINRAPNQVADRIATEPGVALVQTRITGAANLTVPGFDALVSAQLISLPDDGPAALGRLYYAAGGPPTTGDEAAVSDAFAEAHGLAPGDSLAAVLNGRRRVLTLSGVAISPEHVYQVNPGSIFPDAERFGILWRPSTTWRALSTRSPSPSRRRPTPRPCSTGSTPGWSATAGVAPSTGTSSPRTAF